ncbi:TAXI family TRAP transporter solute-binding subunit [Xylophilus sp. GW821-FHT01B05]
MSRMSHTLRNLLLSLRDLLISIGPLALVATVLLVGAYRWLDPNPPRRVTLATGPAESAYAEFGRRYAHALAANGIEVVLLPTGGSSDNLQLLREGRADLGFVRGGSADPVADEEAGLSSLGSLFVEPLWFFYREDAARRLRHDSGALTTLPNLSGLRLNVDTEGSGVPAMVDRLLTANHIDPKRLRLSHLEQAPATAALLEGKLDALVLASAPESPLVQRLLQARGIRLMDFGQSEAYSRRFAFLTPVTLPRGVVDLARDVPTQDIGLIATTTSLLSREETHPALRQLFAQAGQTLHSGAGWFNRAREFPNTRTSELPVSPEGDRAINGTPSLLQRYLPFWVGNLVERMWLVLGILVAVLLPMSRIVPPLYAFRVRSRVFRWYGRLREIEARAESGEDTPQALRAELDQLERQVEKISVPLSYADELYALRDHIDLARNKLASG